MTPLEQPRELVARLTKLRQRQVDCVELDLGLGEHGREPPAACALLDVAEQQRRDHERQTAHWEGFLYVVGVGRRHAGRHVGQPVGSDTDHRARALLVTGSLVAVSLALALRQLRPALRCRMTRDMANHAPKHVRAA